MDPMDRHVSLAALLTCHNRKTTTLKCLEALVVSARTCAVSLTVFLVDDGSTDGTSEAVRTRFPDVRILPGDGALYWTGGMRRAFQAAMDAPEPFDHYLWLNDDAFLFADALERLLDCVNKASQCHRGPSIIVGSMIEPDTQKTSFGGFKKLPILPMLRRVKPGEEMRSCTTMNGNCVLVPDAVMRVVGNFDSQLTHLRGDIDYGFRAAKCGCGVFLAPGHVGLCRVNSKPAWAVNDAPASLRARLQALHSPKYALKEKSMIARRHLGPLWFLSPAAVVVFTILTQPLAWIRSISQKRQ